MVLLTKLEQETIFQGSHTQSEYYYKFTSNTTGVYVES